MGVNVGGINATIGLDFEPLEKGLRSASKRLESFTKKLQGIILKADISGEWLKGLDNYTTELQKSLSTVLNDWSSNITKVSGNFTRTTAKWRNELEKVIRKFDILDKKFRYHAKTREILSELRERPTEYEAILGSHAETLFALTEAIPQVKRLLAPHLSFIGKDKVKILTGYTEIVKQLEKVSSLLSTLAPKFKKEYLDFAETLKKMYKAQEKYKLAVDLERARSELRILEEKTKMMNKLIVAEKEYTTNIKKRFNVLASSRNLISTYKGMEALGIELTPAQLKRAETAYYRTLMPQKIKGTLREAELEAREKIAGSYKKFLIERSRIMKELTIQEKEYTAALEREFTMLEGAKGILKTYQAMLERGVKLDRDRLAIAKKAQQILVRRQFIPSVLEKMRQRTEMEYLASPKALAYKYAADIRKLKFESMILETEAETTRRRKYWKRAFELRRDVEVKKLRIEEAKLRAEMEAGNRVLQVRQRLLDILNRKEELGIELTRRERIERIRLNREIQKERTRGVDQFLSPEWLKYRARWFVQLRLFWSIYRFITDTIQAITAFDDAMAGLSAITMAANHELQALRDTALQLGKDLPVPIEEIATGMTKIAQAGFSAKETASIIKDVSTLATATLGKIETAADLVTTALRAWNMETSRSSEVADILANAVNRSKTNLEGLGTALQYVSGTAPQLNISFKETIALLSEMANRGIRMSVAATGLRAMFAEFLRPSERFRKELYKLGLGIDDVNVAVRGVVPVLKLLAETSFSAEQVFKGLGRRTASAVGALIASAGDIDHMIELLSELGTATEMAGREMESFRKRWILFKNTAVSVGSRVFDLYKGIASIGISGLTELMKGLDSVATSSTQAARAMKMLIVTVTHFGIALAGIGLVKWLINLGKRLDNILLIIQSFRFVLNPWVTGIAAVSGILLYLVAAITRAHHKTKLLLEDFHQARVKALEARMAYDDFNRVLEQYKETVEKGDEVQAKRIASMNKELALIHKLHYGTSEWADAIDKLVEKKKEELKVAEGIERQRFREMLMARLEKVRKLREEKEALTRQKEEFLASGMRITRKEAEAAAGKPRKLSEKDVEDIKMILRLGRGWMKEKWKYEGAIGKDLGFFVDALNKLAVAVGEMPDFAKLVPKWQKEQDKINKEILERAKAIREARARLFIEPITPKDVRAYYQETLKMYPIFGRLLGQLTAEERARWEEMFQKEIPSVMYARLERLREILRESLGEDIIGREFEKLRKEYEEKGIEKSRAELIREALLSVSAGILGRVKTAMGIGTIPYKEDKYRVEIKQLETEILNLTDERSQREKEIEKTIARYVALLERYKYPNKEIQELELLREKHIGAINQKYQQMIEKEMQEYDYRLKIEGTNTTLERRIAEINREYEQAVNKAIQQYGINYDTAKLVEKILELRDKQIAKEKALYNIQNKYRNELLDIEKQLSSLRTWETGKRLKLEEQSLRLQIKRLDSIDRSVLDAEQLFNLDQQRVQLQRQLTDNLEQQRRLADPLYATFAKMKEQLSQMTWSDIISDWAMNIPTGLTQIIYDATGGFQEQKQRVVELEQELQNLQREYDEAIADDDVQRAQALAEQMARLRNEIDDMKNPLKNLKNAFEDFLKSLIDGLRRAIIQVMMLKIVLGIVEHFKAPSSKVTSAAASAGAEAGSAVARAITNPVSAIGTNVGGVNVEAPFGAERVAQDIYIANFVTPQDIANAMTELPGKNVIANHVVQDLRNRGTIWKAIRSSM